MPSADLRRRGGFTLVELLVALVISGFIIATVFQILTSQSRVVAVQGAREEAQQNVRGALEIVSSELRSAIPQGILAAGAQSITFMQPRAWGLVCGSSGANTVDAVFPATQALDAFAVGSTSGVMINAGTSGAPDWKPRTLATWAAVTGVEELGEGEEGECAAAGGMGASGGVESVQITAAGIDTLAMRRREIVLYSLTHYDVQQVDGEWWLRRSNGWDGAGFTQHPLAGPLEAEDGTPELDFIYFSGTPPAQVSAPGTSANLLSAVRMVQISLKTQSQQSVNGHRQKDSSAVTVTLRNAPQ